ncbi:MAG: tRNA (adenosine(37)-N6)-threonylcarbamoyltransferase complex dimerization subunit type 1 TsaB [Polyangiales bacterium]
MHGVDGNISGATDTQNWLAFDCSSNALLLAMATQERVQTAMQTLPPRQHVERVLPTLEAFLHERKNLRTLQMLAVGVGPGSFSGVRVAVATAQALGLALAVPVVPLAAPLLYAYSVRQAEPNAGPILVLLDARRGFVHAAAYDRDARGRLHARAPAQRVPSGALGQVASHLGLHRPSVQIISNHLDVAKAGVAALQANVPHPLPVPTHLPHPRPEALAAATVQVLQDGQGQPADTIAPLYGDGNKVTTPPKAVRRQTRPSALTDELRQEA